MDRSDLQFSSFEWDEDKRVRNVEKHGIDFLKAATALNEPHIERRSDKNGEVRTLAICPLSGILIAIVYTMRSETCRIISARAAHKNEQRKYRQIFAGTNP
ncbi:BrnT family toxin [Pararhizobium sp. LjRoot235]|uniref:BrnT family toxin n=1 Tax=Pararhizobium sp. LjRoot235 TaxID=3342291 RepID=UPI003ED0D62E